MKRFLKLGCIVVIVAVLLSFSACSSGDNSLYLIDRDVDAISIYLRESNTYYELKESEIEELVPLLRDQEELESYPLDLLNLQDRKGITTISVSFKKTLFKKASTDILLYGIETINNKTKKSGYDYHEIMRNNYHGTASDELAIYLDTLINDKESAIADENYETIKNALEANSITINATLTPMPYDNFIKGFECSSLITVKVFKSKEQTREQVEDYGGHSVGRVYYIGMEYAYQIIQEALAA